MLASLWLLVACTGTSDSGDTAPDTDSDTPETGCEAQPPSLVIGTGERDWEDLSAGDPVTMVHGPQGGWHMLGSARINNTGPIVRINFDIRTQGGVAISENIYTVQMIRDEDCSGYYPGMYGYLNVAALEDGELDTPPELLSNTPVVIEMTATDLDGLQATASLEVLAVPDPVDVEKDTGDTGSAE